MSSSTIPNQKKLTLVGHADFRSFRNVWMLEEMEIPYMQIPCPPRTPAARKFHPMGKIPALLVSSTSDSDEGPAEFMVFESAAINTYLGSLQQEILLQQVASGTLSEKQEKQLLVPKWNSPLRREYDQWVCYIMSELDAQALWIHRKHEALGHVYGAIPEAVAAAYSQYARALFALGIDVFVRATAAGRTKRQYLLGDTFSAADILFVHCLNWANSIEWTLEKVAEGIGGEDQQCQEKQEAVKCLKEYAERCRARPGYERAVENRRMEKVKEA